MRLITTLLVSALAACFFPFVTGAQHFHNPRPGSTTRSTHKDGNPQIIAQRQHHVHRDLIDLCLNLDAGVLAPILHILDPLAANIRLCLCLQDLNVFLDSDVGILLGSILGGKDSLLAKIKLLINTSPHSEHCTFPPHSHRLCVAGKPCAFDCDPPYIKDGKKCVCPPPMSECNGVCGNFPHGCSSSVPHKPRETKQITSYAAAKKICTPDQTVCGIPGREGTRDFECVDTRVSLDSCGGCVVQHGFADGPSSVQGTDCGRLHGVMASSCSDSRCIIAKCRSGWHLDTKRNECVKVSAGIVRRSARMNKTGKRDMEVEAVIDTELAESLNAYALLVLTLSNTSQAIAATPTDSHATDSTAPSVDHVYYVNSILVATIYALNSPTVVSLVANIEAIVNVNDLAINAFDQCGGCVDTLGSLYDDLVTVVNAGLLIQNWCGSHPVGIPSNPSDSTSLPNTSGAPIRIGLDDTLNSLGVASRGSYIDIYGLDSLAGATNTLLNGVGLGPANVRPRSPAPSTTALNPESLGKTKILVDAAIVLKNCEPNLPPAPPSDPATPELSPIDYNLINAILQAIANLLQSQTVASYVANVDTAVSINKLVTDALGSCGCIGDLGLAALVENLVTVTEAALGLQDYCSHHPVGAPDPQPATTLSAIHPTATVLPSSAPPSTLLPNSLDTTTILDLDLTSLLDGLGLGSVTSIGALDLGSLLDGLLKPIDTSIVTNGTSSTMATTDVQVNSALVLQIQAIATLALAIENRSAVLPPAPPNSPPIVGSTPAGGNAPINSNLVTGIVQATINLCTSGTGSDLLNNLQVLADVNLLVKSSLTGCDCVDYLGLAGLVRDVDNLLAAVLNAQNWCAGHPVVNPATPHTSTLPTTTVSAPGPTPSQVPGSPFLDLVIDLGLGDLVSALNLGLTTDVNSTADLDDLLNTLVMAVVDIKGHSTSLPPVPTSTLPTASSPASPQPSTSPLPLSQGLVDDLLQAIAVLLNSTLQVDVIGTNIDTLLNLGGLLGESMDHCDCISSLGLEGLQHAVDALLDALLDLHTWCAFHPGSNGGGAGSDIIKIDTYGLLAALGLDGFAGVKGEVAGFGLSNTVNPLLQALGLGGVRRWLLG
ncbi:hypothetical protein DXG01_005442 [Tephrocybe rancida]|nr:hypothetical protein DXG01_005442 [Tephrocybe rancida]